MQTVWVIAGLDSSGCAGIAADVKTLQSMGVHGSVVTTALTVQSAAHAKQQHVYTTSDLFQATLSCLQQAGHPHAIKMGMLGNVQLIPLLQACVSQFPAVPVILDPVLFTSSGVPLFNGTLSAYLQHLRHLFAY